MTRPLLAHLYVWLNGVHRRSFEVGTSKGFSIAGDVLVENKLVQTYDAIVESADCQ